MICFQLILQIFVPDITTFFNALLHYSPIFCLHQRTVKDYIIIIIIIVGEPKDQSGFQTTDKASEWYLKLEYVHCASGQVAQKYYKHFERALKER